MEKFKTISSTNQKAKELAKNGAGPWTVIVAEKQTQGRGKKKSLWYSPSGGLYFSVVLPKSNIEDLQTLTALAAFIIAKTLKESFNIEPLIKLPNDVLLNGKKIAGILTENVVGKEVKSSVIGIGLNTNIESFPRELEKNSTSLKMELGRKIDNSLILEEILKGLKEQLKTISQ
jgi:BirA family biotin operon repressor/biotin-[acetyl-CoA-carboxylase] ligase